MKSFMFYQLCVLKMEMNRMKEENKVLRKVVEQTMKEYYDLQMKFAAIQQDNQRKVVNPMSHYFFFFGRLNSSPLCHDINIICNCLIAL